MNSGQVEQERDDDSGRDRQDAVAARADEAGDDGGETIDSVPRIASVPRPRSRAIDEVRAVLERHGPDAVEGVLGGVRDSHAGEQRDDDADRQAGGAAFQRVQLELVAQDRELAEGSVE